MPTAFSTTGPVSIPGLPPGVPQNLWGFFWVSGSGANCLEKGFYTSAGPLAKKIASTWHSLFYVALSQGVTPFTGELPPTELRLLHYSASGVQKDPILDLFPLFDVADIPGSTKRIRAVLEKWHP